MTKLILNYENLVASFTWSLMDSPFPEPLSSTVKLGMQLVKITLNQLVSGSWSTRGWKSGRVARGEELTGRCEFQGNSATFTNRVWGERLVLFHLKFISVALVLVQVIFLLPNTALQGKHCRGREEQTEYWKEFACLWRLQFFRNISWRRYLHGNMPLSFSLSLCEYLNKIKLNEIAQKVEFTIVFHLCTMACALG